MKSTKHETLEDVPPDQVDALSAELRLAGAIHISSFRQDDGELWTVDAEFDVVVTP